MSKNPPVSFINKSVLTAIVTFLSYLLYKVAEPTVTTATAAATAQLPASEQTIQLYSNQTQDNLTALFANAINSANQSINMVIYALTDPQILQALVDKTNSGVPVYIVCDAKASPGISVKIPKAQIVRRAGKGLTHQKILIIDDKRMIIGSSNMTTDSLRVHGNLVIALENPALAQALTEKIKGMTEGDLSTVPFQHRQVMIGEQNVELWVLPDDKNAAQRMIELFRGAKKSIKVAMFTWTRVDFTQELIKAAQRGVKVETVLDRYSGKGASAKIVTLLLKENIPVALSTGKGLLHHKFAYIDDEILVNGSANWTTSAFKINDDCFIVLYPLNAEQKAKMNQLWEVIKRESSLPGIESPQKVKSPKKRQPHQTPAYAD